MNPELLKIEAEATQLRSDMKNDKITPEDATKKVEELRARKLEIEQREAQKGAPSGGQERSVTIWKDFCKRAVSAMAEGKSISLRAVSLNGTGNVEVMHDLVKVWTKKRPLLERVNYNYGNNAKETIPVLTARPAKPSKKAEGTTDADSDSTAAMAAVDIQPKAYFTEIPVTADTLAMGAVNIESELQKIIADAFAEGLHDDIVSGEADGTVQGMFASVPSANLTEGAITVANLATLALKVADMSDDAELVMSATTYGKFIADPSTDDTTKVYKESLIRDKKIEGVKVTLTSSAPTSVAAGSTAVIATNVHEYNVGIAGDLIIEPLRKPGDTNTYYQAIMFLGGVPIVQNLYGLKVSA